MISQSLFDETLLENQDVFEYTDEEAVAETIGEFLQQSESQTGNPSKEHHRLEHLSLTHPSSPEGKRFREMHERFMENLDAEPPDLVAATSILGGLHRKQREGPTESGENSSSNDNSDNNDTETYRTRLLSLWFLLLQNKLWPKLVEKVGDGDERRKLLVGFVVALLPDSSLSLHPLARDVKHVVAPFWFEAKDCDSDSDNNSGSSPGSEWFGMLERSGKGGGDSEIPLALVRLARSLCNGCEDNKKAFVKAGLLRGGEGKTGLERLLLPLLLPPDDPLAPTGPADPASSSFARARETCRLVAVLSRFQPLADSSARDASACTPEAPQTGGAPVVSSAHANVKEFHRAGFVPRLHRIARESLRALRQQEQAGEESDAGAGAVPSSANASQELLCESLNALRAMAIDNDIVQNMVALGILDTVRDALEVVVEVATAAPVEGAEATRSISKLGLATAALGLVRNLCANDEVKTTICRSSLHSILRVMQHYLDEAPGRRTTRGHAALQEHACGILAAMALRQPQNAHATVEEGGHVLVFRAMRVFPDTVALQRQGCLAVRNIASRLARADHGEDVAKLLDAGAEDVLQTIAGRHPASAEEAYAALRDLGCNPQMYQMDEHGNTVRSTREVFGAVKSSFRAVYE